MLGSHNTEFLVDQIKFWWDQEFAPLKVQHIQREASWEKKLRKDMVEIK